jgi:hypothetical protein
MTMLEPMRANPQQLQLELEALPGLEEIARRLRELDHALGTADPPPVLVRTRRNRSTLGSLRLGAGPPAVWRFTVDAGLLERDPRGALDLGLLLMHRARRKRPPRDLGLRLSELRADWGEVRPVRRPQGLLADPRLEARLGAVARLAFPELSRDQLPAVIWTISRSRRVLGRYDSRARRIEIHGALRHPGVPEVVLDNLLHHELLHALLGGSRQGSRLVHHHAEFRKLERTYPGYSEAVAWEERHWLRWLARHHDNGSGRSGRGAPSCRELNSPA